MGWNKNLDFETTWEKLYFAFTSKAQRNKKYFRESKRSKIAILLICLRNGCRASEGIDAFNNYLKDTKKKQLVRVRKRGFAYKKDANGKKHRASGSTEPENPVFREILIPDIIQFWCEPYQGSVSNLTQFSVHNFGFGVHALRYAFISHLSKKGTAPQVIAKITKHASLNEIVRYCEQEVADAVLKDGVL